MDRRKTTMGVFLEFRVQELKWQQEPSDQGLVFHEDSCSPDRATAMKETMSQSKDVISAAHRAIWEQDDKTLLN